MPALHRVYRCRPEAGALVSVLSLGLAKGDDAIDGIDRYLFRPSVRPRDLEALDSVFASEPERHGRLGFAQVGRAAPDEPALRASTGFEDDPCADRRGVRRAAFEIEAQEVVLGRAGREV